MAFLCVSQQGELKNAIETKNPCLKLFAKHLRGGNFSLPCFPSICFIAFFAVSLHEHEKKLENLKKSQKQLVGTSQIPRPLSFVLFLSPVLSFELPSRGAGQKRRISPYIC
jgi:hypothetical protein